MTDEITVCVALLHDVVEDTAMTPDDLKAAGFPGAVTEAQQLLTHDPTTDYFDYVRAIRTNPVAKAVKLADLAHNSDESRFAGCERVNAEQLACWREKYAKAKAILESSE